MTLLKDAPRPKVHLVGYDGNAFAILGRCKKAAMKAGWTGEMVKEFMDEAMNGDYNHLLRTVMEHFDDAMDEADYEECPWCGCEMRGGACTAYCDEEEEEDW